MTNRFQFGNAHAHKSVRLENVLPPLALTKFAGGNPKGVAKRLGFDNGGHHALSLLMTTTPVINP
jgi:hypothetical protein